MSYFMKLRNHYQNQNNIIDDPSLTDEVFLNSEDIIKLATKLQNSSSLNSTVLVQTSQNNKTVGLHSINHVNWGCQLRR